MNQVSLTACDSALQDEELRVIVPSNLLGATPQSFIDKIAAFYLPGLKAEGK